MGAGRGASRSRSRSRSTSHERHGREASSSRSRSPPEHSLRRPVKRPRSSRSESREPIRHYNSRSTSKSRSRSRDRQHLSIRSEREAGIRPKHNRSRSPSHRSHRSKSPPRGDRNRDKETQGSDVLGRDRDRQQGGERSRDRDRERDRQASCRDRERDRDGDRDREARGREVSNRGRDREARDRDRDRQTRERDRDREASNRDRNRDRGYNRDSIQEQPHSRSRWEQPPPQLGRQSSWDRGVRGGGAPHGSVPPGSDMGGGFRRLLLSDEPPEVGSIHSGVVQSVKPFGVFVAIQGHRKHVLVHHTQVSAEVVLTRSDEDELKVKALEYAAAAGQKVWVKILEVSPDQTGSGFRVHGSMLVVDQNDGTDLDPTGQMAASRGPGGGGGAGRLSDEPPEVHSVHRGEVKRIEAYGVFVALQGYRRYGLVHASQVANYLEFSAEDNEAERKKALAEVVEVGQSVFVKVVEVTQDDRGLKIGCSMKLVDQADGTDLDPQNLRYRPRGEAGHGPGSKAPVGASAGEVKGGTIDWGYLATRPDAFGSSGYDLLQEEPEQQQPGQTAAGARGAYPPPPQQQQQLPSVGRGRGAVLPAWMSQGPAVPGSVPNRDTSGAPADMTVEEALRIIQAATGKEKKKHKEKHKKHKKDSKHKSHKSKKSKHSSKKRSRSRSRSRGRGSSDSSDSDSR